MLLVCSFPFVGIFYLMVGEQSVPWVTRGLYLMYIGGWCLFGAHKVFRRRIQLGWLDALMFAYFVLLLYGYIRSDFASVEFKYFFALNCLPYLIGRLSSPDEIPSALVYMLMVSILATVLFDFSLPELFEIWARPDQYLQHPIISTVGGIDEIMGMLSVFSAVYLLQYSDCLSKKKIILLIVIVMLCVAMAILLSSRTVYVASVITIIVSIFFVGNVFQKKNLSLLLLVALISSTLMTYSFAPENNKRFIRQLGIGNLTKVSDSIARQSFDGIEAGDGVSVRLALWGEALKKMSDSQWIGSGVEKWTYTHPKPHPHNVVLESGQVFGIPSAFILLTFFGVIFFSSKDSKLVSKKEQLVRISVIGLSFYFLINNLLQGQIGSFRSLPLFLLAGIATAIIAESNLEKKEITSKL